MKYLDYVKECIGVKFRWMGRDKFGIDCIGLTYYPIKQMGKEYEKSNTFVYKSFTFESEIDNYFNHFFDEVKDMQTGDVLMFSLDRNIKHFAVLDGDHIIHANILNRKVVREYFNDDLKKRIIKIYRYKN